MKDLKTSADRVADTECAAHVAFFTGEVLFTIGCKHMCAVEPKVAHFEVML